VLHTPVGDVLEIPPGKYEMVLIAFVLHHVDIEHPRVIVQNVTETVKTGARICIVDFDNTKQSQDARKRIYHTNHPEKKRQKIHGIWNGFRKIRHECIARSIQFGAGNSENVCRATRKG
jgi:hypothetical protein